MEWKSATPMSERGVQIPDRWIFLHYYEALNILFRAENALRVFVYVVLKNEFNEKWADSSIQITDDEQSTIAGTANKRIAQAKGFGYLGYEISSPLLYLNSGELTRLMTSDTYWTLFKSFFKGKKEVIKTKLDEVATVRNSLAHFRPIKQDDVELIKQNIRHAYAGIEECLSEMTQTMQIVPTNTEDSWYKNLSVLGTSLCALKLYQNKSEKWIRIEIGYRSLILSHDSYGQTYQSYQITNLISPALVKEYADLARYCTFVTEMVQFVPMPTDLVPKFGKTISIIFNKSVLSEHHEIIEAQLKDLLTKVDTESELLQNDHLARGKIVESAQSWAVLSGEGEQRRWIINTDGLKSSFGDDDPAEYWGDLGLYIGDLITTATRYPWMPSDVSKFEFPF